MYFCLLIFFEQDQRVFYLQNNFFSKNDDCVFKIIIQTFGIQFFI